MGAATSISGESEMKEFYEQEKTRLREDQRARLERKYREVKKRSRGFTMASLNACREEWNEVVVGSRNQAHGPGASSVSQKIKQKWDKLNEDGVAVAKADFDLTPSDRGAWGKTTAPMTLFTQFLLAVQQERIDNALDLSEKILDHEPENKLIKEYQPALLAKKKLMEEEDEEDESEEESEEDESDEEDESIFDREGKEGDDGDEEEGGQEEEDLQVETTLHKLRGGWLIQNEVK